MNKSFIKFVNIFSSSHRCCECDSHEVVNVIHKKGDLKRIIVFLFVVVYSLHANAIRAIEVFAMPSQNSYSFAGEGDENLSYDEISIALGSAFDLIGRDEKIIFRASGFLNISPFMQSYTGDRESSSGNDIAGKLGVSSNLFFNNNLYVGLSSNLDIEAKHSMDFDFISESHLNGQSTNAFFKTYTKAFVDIGLMSVNEMTENMVSDTSLFPKLPRNVNLSAGLSFWYYSKWKEDRSIAYPEVRQATEAIIRLKYGRQLIKTARVDQNLDFSFEQALGSKTRELFGKIDGLSRISHNIFILSRLQTSLGKWEKQGELDEQWFKLGISVNAAMYFENGILPFAGLTYQYDKRIGINFGLRYSIDGRFTSKYLFGDENFDPRFNNKF